MAYNENLADRITQILDARKIKFTEKKMFGGLCFLVDDKMLMGVEKERLMVRIDQEDEPKALKKKGAKPMDFTGRVMKGFLFVDDKAVELDKELEYWVDLCLKYNPKAKASKSKAKAKVASASSDNKLPKKSATATKAEAEAQAQETKSKSEAVAKTKETKSKVVSASSKKLPKKPASTNKARVTSVSKKPKSK